MAHMFEKLHDKIQQNSEPVPNRECRQWTGLVSEMDCPVLSDTRNQ
jgi:hypothetical protein